MQPSLSPRMQVYSVWFPALVLEPVPGHAAKAPELGSRKMDLEFVSSQPSAREPCARTRERAVMQV